MSGITTWRFDTPEGAVLAGDSDAVTYAWTAALLTGLLAVVVPAVGLASDLPTPALVVAAGVLYVATVLAAGVAFEGFAASVFVLGLFDIAVVLVDGPGIATLDLVAVDVVAIPLFFVLVYDWLADRGPLRPTARVIAVVAFAGFVGWTFLAALFGSGPSGLAAGLYAIEQLRYFVVFAVAALVVRRTNAWCAIYPFVIATAGHLVISLAQITNSGRLGFPFLGEPPDRFFQPTFTLGATEIATGFYAGGFVGHGRELAMVLFLFIPLVLAIALRHSWGHVGLASVGIAASMLSIRVANTDAGWATLLLLSAVFGTYLLGVGLVRAKRKYSTLALVPASTAVVAFALVLLQGFRALVRSDSVNGGTLVVGRGAIGVRIEQYVVAVRIALANPLFGLGGKNLYLVSRSYGLGPDIGVHNTYLSNLAATGFVGFGLYLLAALAVLWIAVRLAFDTSGDERALWVAVICAMFAYHAYSSWMMSYHWTVGNTAFWLLAGVAVGGAAARWRDTVTSISGRIV
ncbi:O-antigen ligase family protein [Halococcus agarilyticus]|uniref:O-antigen ligase family protein n=1 Tax=Halococcus agarilyticus TaxID=1232219 RepID=UPI000B29056C|nr:O-antigen ligase family protein [Halococcus agarilyticus]